MVTWKQFEESEPELAALGEGQLFQFGVGLAFLATVRKDGAPRLHPLCPVLHDGHLYIFVPQSSPKREDLLRDGRYALQVFPPPKEVSEEFYLTGKAVLIRSPAALHNRRLLLQLRDVQSSVATQISLACPCQAG